MAFKDGNPAAPDSQRYKAVSNTDRADWDGGIFGFVSPDGTRWMPIQDTPLLPNDHQGYDGPQAPAFWDRHRGQYRAYLRAWATGDGEEVPKFKAAPQARCWRTIRTSTSQDFINWTDPELVEFDVPLSVEEQFYTNAIQPYFRAPHILIGLPKRFTPLRKKVPEHAATGVSDGGFIASRDGLHWKRWLEAFIRPGPDPKNWVERNNLPASGIVETAPGELSVYWTEHLRTEGCRVRRGTLRTDGFVSVQAGHGGGEMLTRPFTFDGSQLIINYSTSAFGSLQVEVQDVEGRPVNGFNLSQCPVVYGDEVEHVVAWEEGSDVGSLAGRPVRLRFALKDADLFSIRFR